MVQCESCIHIKKNDKRKKKRIVKRKGKGEMNGVCVRVSRERERERKKSFYFSQISTEIGPSVFIGARGKVSLRYEGYTWVPKSWSFVKLHEVGNFPTLNISSLKVI